MKFYVNLPSFLLFLVKLDILYLKILGVTLIFFCIFSLGMLSFTVRVLIQHLYLSTCTMWLISILYKYFVIDLLTRKQTKNHKNRPIYINPILNYDQSIRKQTYTNNTIPSRSSFASSFRSFQLYNNRNFQSNNTFFNQQTAFWCWVFNSNFCWLLYKVKRNTQKNLIS